jgi:hypothetical protein
MRVDFFCAIDGIAKAMLDQPRLVRGEDTIISPPRKRQKKYQAVPFAV